MRTASGSYIESWPDPKPLAVLVAVLGFAVTYLFFHKTNRPISATTVYELAREGTAMLGRELESGVAMTGEGINLFLGAAHDG